MHKQLAAVVTCEGDAALIVWALSLPPERREDWWAAIQAVVSGEEDELPAAQRDYISHQLAPAGDSDALITALTCRATELIMMEDMTAAERTAWEAGVISDLIWKHIDQATDSRVVQCLIQLAREYDEMRTRLAAICEDNIFRHKKEVVGIGERLHAMGGIEWMQRAYRDVAARVPARLGYQHEVTPVKPGDPGFDPSMISSAWDNVGYWQN